MLDSDDIKLRMLNLEVERRAYSRLLTSITCRFYNEDHKNFEQTLGGKINKIMIDAVINTELRISIVITSPKFKKEIEDLLPMVMIISSVHSVSYKGKVVFVSDKKPYNRFRIVVMVNYKNLEPMDGDISDPLLKYIKVAQKIEMLALAIGD